MPTDTTSAGPPSGRWPNSTSTIRTLATRSAALCLTDPNPFVRPEAVQTLACLLGGAAVPTLEALANDTNTMVRRVAADELARLTAAPPAESFRPDAGRGAPQS